MASLSEGPLQRYLALQERRRRRILILRHWGFWAIAALCTAMVFSIDDDTPFFAALAGAGLVSAIAGFTFRAWLAKDLNDRLRVAIVDHFCTHLGLTYHDNRNPPAVKPLVDAGLLPTHTRCSHNDGITGHIDGAAVSVIQTLLTSRSSGGESSSTFIHFDGLQIALQLPFIFDGHIILRPGPRETSGRHAKRKPAEKIERAGGLFDHFEIHSNDAALVDRLLTPEIQQALNDLNGAPYVKEMRAAFLQGNLIITLDKSRRLFEIDAMKMSLTSGQVVAHCRADLRHLVTLMLPLLVPPVTDGASGRAEHENGSGETAAVSNLAD